jgi:DNA-binding beta-propeller fold protein YncE
MVLALSLPAGQVQAAGNTYVADEDGSLMPVPEAYEVYDCIYNLEEYGVMNHPQDIFVDGGDIYVADTDNNRILKMDMDGTVKKEYTEAFGRGFSTPGGIFRDKSGNIWVADTGNLRIAVIDGEGGDVAEYGKPDSALLSENFAFDAQKIAVNSIGNIYALKGANLMTIDQANNFHGYLGAAEVGFSLSRLLIRTFGSQSQVERTLKQEPAAYSNFTIGADGMIYGILATEEKDQIRRLNSVGNNTYPEGKYGLIIEQRDKEEPVKPFFADIAVMDNGIITVVDKNTGLLYQYDQDGNLLAAFGGIGDYAGVYSVPVSLDVDENGFLYVLDYSANTITILRPTEFIRLVHQAVTLYDAGKYAEAREYWQKVIDIDSNYALAHQGVGKVSCKEEDYKSAMEQYRLGDDREGYSEAYGEHRLELFRDNFLWITAAAFGILFGLYKLICLAKDKARRWAELTQMGGDL